MPINISKIRNLVFAGGGVKVVAYAGAIKALEEKGHLSHIHKVAGTSGGAITALCVALGYNSREIEDILKNMDFNKFADTPNLLYTTAGSVVSSAAKWVIKSIPSKTITNNVEKVLPYSAEILQLLCERGMHSGDALEKFLEDLVFSQGFNKDITFGALHKHTDVELSVLTANLNTQFSKIISHTSHPEGSVVKWVHASGAFPLYFKPVEIASMLYVDGGIINNYPINVFDGSNLKAQCTTTDENTLGFKPISGELIKAFYSGEEPEVSMPIDSIIDQGKALVETAMSTDILSAFINHERTVLIPDHNISTLAFDISPEQKQTLIESGYNATCQFIEDNTVECLGEVS